MLFSGFTEEQTALRSMVRDLVRTYDRKYWVGCVNDDRYPDELWQAMADANLLGIGVPEEYGGVGMGTTELIVATEELYRAGLILSSWNHTNFSRAAVLRVGTEAQKRAIIPGTTTGKVRISLCVTEPDAGTNTFRVRTAARNDGEGYRLNGQKVFIGGADISDYYFVVARSKPIESVDDRRKGISAFLVDARSPGITLTRMDIVAKDVVGRFVINFDDVSLPPDALIGSPGDAMRGIFSNLNIERILVAAQCIGLGYHVLERAVDYVKIREVFDGPIGAYQSVQHPLARAKADLDAARLLMYYAASVYEEDGRTPHEANMAKLLASEAAFAAADAAVQFHGGSAFDRTTDIWDIYTYLRLQRVAPVNNEMMLNYIAERVLGLPRSY